MDYTSNIKKAPKAAIVFIHGIFSNSSCWDTIIEFLKQDLLISQCYLFYRFTYSSPHVSINPKNRIPNLFDIASTLETCLNEDNELKLCTRIVLIGHSQGGLVIQRFLADQIIKGKGNELSRISGVITFATPNTGSELFLSVRRLLDIIWFHPQEHTLRPNNDMIDDMRKIILEKIVYSNIISNSSCPIPYKVYAGASDGVVPAKSAKWFFPNAGILPGNHSSIIKPQNEDDLIVDSTINFLHQALSSFPSDKVVVQTNALNVDLTKEIDDVIELQNEEFAPCAHIRKDDLVYWIKNYEINFGIHLSVVVAKINDDILGFLMFHEHIKWIVIDYIVIKNSIEIDNIRNRTAVGELIKTKLVARLLVRAKELDVPVIFEVEDPSFLQEEESQKAKARIRLFEREGARVIQGFAYLAPHMEHISMPGHEEKYLLMYARPGKVQDELIQSEVKEIVDFLYNTWYRNWFSHTSNIIELETYLKNLFVKVTSNLLEKFPLPKQYHS